jgi:hypothetical protein
LSGSDDLPGNLGGILCRHGVWVHCRKHLRQGLLALFDASIGLSQGNTFWIGRYGSR